MDKLKIGFIGLGQRGAAYGMTDGYERQEQVDEAFDMLKKIFFGLCT